MLHTMATDRFRPSAKSVALILLTVMLWRVASAQNGQRALNQLSADDIDSFKRNVSATPLTDGEITAAIAVGIKDTNKSGLDIGLTLDDAGQRWSNSLSEMAGDSDSKSSEHSGFVVRMFTPSAWIAWNAHEAKRKYLSYAVGDVRQSDRLQILRIIVEPDTPAAVVAGSGIQRSSSLSTWYFVRWINTM